MAEKKPQIGKFRTKPLTVKVERVRNIHEGILWFIELPSGGRESLSTSEFRRRYEPVDAKAEALIRKSDDQD